jgi:hypothetical protein
VAQTDKLLISRNPPVVSRAVFRLGKLLDFPSLLRVGLGEQLEKLCDKTNGGSGERMIEITTAKGVWRRRIYLDGSTPVPSRIESKGTVFKVLWSPTDLNVKYQLRDYAEFHGLQFPRTLSQFDENVEKIHVRVEELVDARYEESSFVPPADSRWIWWCAQPEPPKLKSLTPGRSNAALPPQFRAGGPPSEVVISGVIGIDGQWHNLEAVKSAGAIVDSFWMKVLQRQRYAPAQCGKAPVEYEMMAQLDYP